MSKRARLNVVKAGTGLQLDSLRFESHQLELRGGGVFVFVSKRSPYV